MRGQFQGRGSGRERSSVTGRLQGKAVEGVCPLEGEWCLWGSMEV